MLNKDVKNVKTMINQNVNVTQDISTKMMDHVQNVQLQIAQIVQVMFVNNVLKKLVILIQLSIKMVIKHVKKMIVKLILIMTLKKKVVKNVTKLKHNVQNVI